MFGLKVALLTVSASAFAPAAPAKRLVALRAGPADAAGGRWAVSELFEEIKSDHVQKAVFSADAKEVVAMTQDGAQHAVSIMEMQTSEVVQALRAQHVAFEVAAPVQDMVAQYGQFVLPVIVLGGLFLLARNAGGQGGGGPGGGAGPMGMLQSRAKVEVAPLTGVTFADVAGCDDSKLELEEVVGFLKDPSKYDAVGANCPRGIILEGPPGTGKTLLAKAVAGEAGVPFIATSGSEFVEMFVGVGASRIRSMFDDAKKNSPCIIFIDEIDAIGRQRSSGGGMQGSNDEREQTLNQILTEMDGFKGNTGVIVIAATNRADVLDAALLRPGRFDRRVPVDAPDKKGRVAILKVHSRDKPLGADVDLDVVAARTTGFSGAALQNLMNEAAIFAVRADRDVIEATHIEDAIDRLTVGQSKRGGKAGSESWKQRQELVAYHEAGHAVAAALTPGYDSVSKVTIIPRSNGAGGFTLFLPSEDRAESGLYSSKYLKSQLVVALGGRVAEQLAFGDDEVTTGASNDLQQVRSLARRMIAQWGFRARANTGVASVLDSPVAWETPDGKGAMGAATCASQGTERLLDAETKMLVEDAFETCRALLTENKPLLDAVVKNLVEFETIDATMLTNLVLEYSSMPKLTNNSPAAAPAEPVAV